MKRRYREVRFAGGPCFSISLWLIPLLGHVGQNHSNVVTRSSILDAMHECFPLESERARTSLLSPLSDEKTHPASQLFAGASATQPVESGHPFARQRGSQVQRSFVCRSEACKRLIDLSKAGQNGGDEYLRYVLSGGPFVRVMKDTCAAPVFPHDAAKAPPRDAA